MTTRWKGDFPADLTQVCRRFEQMRQSRKTRSRIPEPLWVLAVKMANKYGINRTANTLRISYYSLKNQVERLSTAKINPTSFNASRGKAAARPIPLALKNTAAFIELPPLVSAEAAEMNTGPCECTLEMEDVHETKLRVHLRSITAPDLAMLCRSFCSRP
jgi:hypothetical protein